MGGSVSRTQRRQPADPSAAPALPCRTRRAPLHRRGGGHPAPSFWRLSLGPQLSARRTPLSRRAGRLRPAAEERPGLQSDHYRQALGHSVVGSSVGWPGHLALLPGYHLALPALASSLRSCISRRPTRVSPCETLAGAVSRPFGAPAGSTSVSAFTAPPRCAGETPHARPHRASIAFFPPPLPAWL